MKKQILKYFKTNKNQIEINDILKLAKKLNVSEDQINIVIYQLLQSILIKIQNGDILNGRRKTKEFDVDDKQLEIGVEVEMEHTNNPNIAEAIALDHLAEHDDYYTKLILAGLVDEQPALDLYKHYYV